MDLKRIVGLVLVIGGALVFALMAMFLYTEIEPEASPYWWIGASYSGVVEQVDPGRIRIATENAGEQSFRVDALTRVVLMGDVRLVPGAFVRVKYKALKDDKIARGIRVLSEPNTATRGARPSGLPAQ